MTTGEQQATVDALFEAERYRALALRDNHRMTDPRMYPDRPYLAVSAAIIRDGHVLVARRAKGASTGLYTLPGGVVEAGETLASGDRARDRGGNRHHHRAGRACGSPRIHHARRERTRLAPFRDPVFRGRWLAGEGMPQIEELSELRWLRPSEIAQLKTTEGLADIVAAAFERMEA